MLRLIVVAIAFLVAAPCRADNKTFERTSAIATELIGLYAEKTLCGVVDSDKAETYRSQLRAALAAITEPGFIDSAGLSPMDYAVIADDVSALKRLAGIDYRFSTTKDVGTLLSPAVEFASRELVAFLLDSGLSVNDTTSSGHTPLMVAVGENRPEMVTLLLARGALVNVRTSTGGTALHFAFVCSNPEVIRQLLNAGAQIDDTALELARKHNLESLLKMKANNQLKDDAQKLRAP